MVPGAVRVLHSGHTAAGRLGGWLDRVCGGQVACLGGQAAGWAARPGVLAARRAGGWAKGVADGRPVGQPRQLYSKYRCIMIAKGDTERPKAQATKPQMEPLAAL